MTCTALLDGKIDVATFTAERIADPRVRSLMQKVQVIHDQELDKLQPANHPCRLAITLKNGETKLSSVDNVKGHVKNPFTDSDLEQKLMTFSNGLLSSNRTAKLIDLCWRLDEVDDVREVISATRI